MNRKLENAHNLYLHGIRDAKTYNYALKSHGAQASRRLAQR